MNKKIVKELMTRAINKWMIKTSTQAFFPKEDDIRKTYDKALNKELINSISYKYHMNIVRMNDEYFYGKQNYYCSLSISTTTISIKIYHFTNASNMVVDYETNLF